MFLMRSRFFASLFFNLICFSGHAQFCETPIGFGRNATGGAGGTVYTVTNRNNSGAGSLRTALESNNAYIINFAVTGTITLSSDINVKSNKTVDGDGVYIRIRPFGFRINNQQNIIIRNLHFDSDHQNHGGTGDAISISTDAKDIWIDHCSFEDYYDGLVDITIRSDNVTVSWCYFRAHDKTMLIGANDSHTSDIGKLNVTIHHNFFDGTNQRHPRSRFGRIHVLNNYFKDLGSYAVASCADAKTHIERNRFENISNPTRLQLSSNYQGYITETGNQRINSGTITTRSPSFTPSSYYSYTAETADNTLRDFLVAYAGYNKTTSMSLSVSGNTMTANYLARSFQWYRNGVSINGATSSSYTAPNCGTYSVRLYGDQGCYKELSHTITTGQPAVPTITVVGGNAYFCTGSSVTLRSSAAPSGYSYQWSRNNTDINGATSRDYIASQQGNYRVRLTGACPTSNAALTFIEDRGLADCLGVCGGTAIPDCHNDCNGTAVIDNCGICSGGNTGLVPNAAKDCNGICFGSDTLDCAGVCGGTAILDCHGECDGTAFMDDCGICSGGNTGFVPNAGQDCAGVCFGSATFDCENVCDGTAVFDSCGICLEPQDSAFNQFCMGCNGVVNSGYEWDTCGQCFLPLDIMFNSCNMTSVHSSSDNIISIRIYPNPATVDDKLKICFSALPEYKAELILFNVSGKQEVQEFLLKECNEINLQGIMPGMYLYSLRGSHPQSGRIVVVR